MHTATSAAHQTQDFLNVYAVCAAVGMLRSAAGLPIVDRGIVSLFDRIELLLERRHKQAWCGHFRFKGRWLSRHPLVQRLVGRADRCGIYSPVEDD
ncbi:hypothetical protein [Actinomadura kijaniata]|uniref:hypothetical protein n=1 Tax=Actinomadura kijaniata TaxID=46161 RepID=UPI00082BAA1E|nr:hypothetical protein [Actinomadura kijaniata]